MIYESKVSFTTIDNNGNDKQIKQRYIVENAETFADAEEQTYAFCEGETALDVTDIKRSKLKEILNTRQKQDDAIFIADVADIQYDDDGNEVELVYKLALFAQNLDDAYAKLKEHLKQGYSMIAIGVKKSKIIDVISE